MSRTRGISYFGSRISDNLAKTPEGFLIAPDVVIARTGWQTYTVRDLPQDRAEELGIDITNWSAQINLYRTPEEVFDPATIASFEGKPICDDHPPGFVDTENFTEFARGHIQNVRKGPEALESGDWPLIADLLFTVESLISKIENNTKRELSCGYSYDIEQVGDKILQVGILGNHVAVVDKGRAGAEARINDHAIEDAIEEPELNPESEAAPAIAIDQSEAGDSSSEEVKPPKEKVTVKITDKLKHVFGLGLKQMAADASPEDLAEAAGEYNRLARDCDSMSEEERKEKETADKAAKDAADKAARDKATKDAEEEAKRKEEESGEGAEDSEMHRVARTMGDHRCVNCADADEKCKGCRMHDSLDKMLAASEENENEEEGEDADLQELGQLFQQYMGEEAQEPEHAGDGEEIIEPEEEEESAMAHDSEGRIRIRVTDTINMLEPAIERSKDAAVKRAFDSAPLHDSAEFLKAMKPSVARTKDARVKAAFDAAEKSLRPTRASSGGYGPFRQAAGKGRDAAPETKLAERNTNLQKYYDNASKGAK